jgi:hypothetical protein
VKRFAALAVGLFWLLLATPAGAVEVTVTRRGPVAERVDTVLAGMESVADVAWNGREFVFLWSHEGIGGAFFQTARVSADGAMVDRRAAVIANSFLGSYRLACGRDGCLAVWSSVRSSTGALEAQALSLEGLPRGEPLVVPTAELGGPFDLAGDGSGYLIVGALRALAIRADGSRVGPFATGLDCAGRTSHQPALAFDGQTFFVACGDRAVRITSEGAIAGGVVTLPSSNDARVAWNGAHHLLVWSEPGSPLTLMARRLSREGVPVDPMPIVVTAAGGNADVASDGDGWLVAWSDQESGRVRAARVDSGGVLLDPEAVIVTPPDAEAAGRGLVIAQRPSIAPGAGTWMITMVRAGRARSSFAHAVRLRTGKVIDPAPLLLSLGRALQTGPRVAVGPAGALVTWTETREIRAGHARTMDPAGLNPGPVIDLGVVPEAVGAQAGEWTIVGSSDDGPRAVRVTPGGATTVEWALPARDCPDVPLAVASSGSTQLVLLQSYRTCSSQSEAEIRGVLHSGREMRWSRTIVEAPSYRPAAAWDGVAYRVSALRELDLTRDIVMTALDEMGREVPGAAARSSTSSSDGAVRWRAPTVAAAQGAALIAWADGRRIMGATLAPGGALLGGAPSALIDAGEPARFARAVWDGQRWLVIWLQGQSSASMIVRGLLVDRSGAPIDGAFDVGSSADPNEIPGVACAPNGGCLVAYTSLAGDLRGTEQNELVHIAARGTPRAGDGCGCALGRRPGPTSAFAILLVLLLLRRNRLSG